MNIDNNNYIILNSMPSFYEINSIELNLDIYQDLFS